MPVGKKGCLPGQKTRWGRVRCISMSGNRDTYLRIHGTPAPRSIGTRASSGCVRMVMPHINTLYDQVDTGVTAYLYPTDGGPLKSALWTHADRVAAAGAQRQLGGLNRATMRVPIASILGSNARCCQILKRCRDG